MLQSMHHVFVYVQVNVTIMSDMNVQNTSDLGFNKYNRQVVRSTLIISIVPLLDF